MQNDIFSKIVNKIKQKLGRSNAYTASPEPATKNHPHIFVSDRSSLAICHKNGFKLPKLKKYDATIAIFPAGAEHSDQASILRRQGWTIGTSSDTFLCNRIEEVVEKIDLETPKITFMGRISSKSIANISQKYDFEHVKSPSTPFDYQNKLMGVKA